MTKLSRMRHDSVLVLLDDRGKPHVEIRPLYADRLGAAVEVFRVNGPEPVHLVTFRLATVQVLVRRLPLVCSAALRLQSRARNAAK